MKELATGPSTGAGVGEAAGAWDVRIHREELTLAEDSGREGMWTPRGLGGAMGP